MGKPTRIPLPPDFLYRQLKNELAIGHQGSLFLAIYTQTEVKDAIIARLREELPTHFHFPLQLNDLKIQFSTFFSQTFEQTGEHSDVFHVLGIEQLPAAAQLEFLRSLQYGRENFKSLGYSLVFWVSPAFVTKLFHVAPDFYHWLNGTYDFSTYQPTGETSYAWQRENFLGNLKTYLEKLIWQYEHWEEVLKTDFLLEVMSRANLHKYYVELYCTEIEKGLVAVVEQGGTFVEDSEETTKESKIVKKEQEIETIRPLEEILNEFLTTDKRNFLTLLGDFATGKSSFSLHYFVLQAKAYLSDKSLRIPLFVSLKDYPNKLNLQTFIQKEFKDRFVLNFSLSVFQELALAGQFFLVVDGFDEMISMANQQETIGNFKELTKLTFENLQFMTLSQADKKNKVFMTCRTHYFVTEAQEQAILKADYTMMYRNYATKSQYQISRIYVKEFTEKQIKEYILKTTENQTVTQDLLKIIHGTYNLSELAARPLLLDMIVKMLSVLKNRPNINIADLYSACTDEWIERDDWRSQLTPPGKRQFMRELALKMYQGGGSFSLHYSQLDKPKSEFLKNPGGVSEDYYAYETTTCAFLNRDVEGNYKFIHKSFMEYFLAEYFFHFYIGEKREISLKYSELNNEVRCFFKFIISTKKPILSYLNLSDFTLSEIDLKGVNLEGANLKKVNFEGTNLEGANLKGAILRKANLRKTRLVEANLEEADLSMAEFGWGANIGVGNFANIHLAGATITIPNNSSFIDFYK